MVVALKSESNDDIEARKACAHKIEARLAEDLACLHTSYLVS